MSVFFFGIAPCSLIFVFFNYLFDSLFMMLSSFYCDLLHFPLNLVEPSQKVIEFLFSDDKQLTFNISLRSTISAIFALMDQYI